MEKTYSQKLSGVPSNFIMLATFLVLGGIFGFFYTNRISIIFAVLGIGIFTLRDAIEFNFENNQFRKCTIFFGIKMGKWKPFKIPDYIALVKVKQVYAVHSRAQTGMYKGETCKLNLVYGKKYETFTKGKYEKVLELSNEIAKAYNITINDCTIRNKKKT